MTEPMSDERLAEIRRYVDTLYPDRWSGWSAMRDLLAEVDRLRAAAAAGHGRTDKEKLLALLADFGLEPTGEEVWATPPNDSVILREGHGGVGGYFDFFARFGFDEAGKFLGLGIYE